MIATSTIIGLGATTLIAYIGKYKMLEKMGEKGWKALVPFLGEYLLYKHVWDTRMFWASLATSAASCGIVQFLEQTAHPNMILASVGLGLTLIGAGITLNFLYNIAKSFGHGFGCTLGLVLAEPIVCLALGFGKSEYAS